MDLKTNSNNQEAEINQEGTIEHVKGLLADYVPPMDDEPNPNEADPQVDDKGQPEPDREPELDKKELEGEREPEPGEAEPVKQPDAAVKTWEYRGKQYTLEQMQELGILDDVIQTARQFPTIQTKYQKLLEERTPQAPGQAAAPQQATPAQQGPSGEQILAAYTPEMERMAGAGYIEEEAYQAFPRLISSLMFHRDLIYDVRDAVAAMMRQNEEQTVKGQRSTFITELDGMCGRISGEDEHFKLMADREVRDGFYKYLGTLNVPINEVDEEFVKRQWIAYNSAAVLEAINQTANERREKNEIKRRNAKGESSTAKPAPAGRVDKTFDTKLIDSFLDGDFATGG